MWQGRWYRSYDFLEDPTTARGGRLHCLTILDEYTREGLAIEVAPSIGSEKVIDALGRLVDERGVPEFIRSDNGPEFVAKPVQAWLEKKMCQAATNACERTISGVMAGQISYWPCMFARLERINA